MNLGKTKKGQLKGLYVDLTPSQVSGKRLEKVHFGQKLEEMFNGKDKYLLKSFKACILSLFDIR